MLNNGTLQMQGEAEKSGSVAEEESFVNSAGSCRQFLQAFKSGASRGFALAQT